MKIGIDVSQVNYPGTGVGTYTYNLVKALLEDQSGHEFVLFGGSLRKFSSLKQQLESFNVQKKLYLVPPLGMDLIFNRLHTLPIELFTGTIDVFHSSDWAQPSSTKARLVTTIHDLTTIKYPQHQHPKIITTHARRLKRVKEDGIHIIADSKATKKDIIHTLGIESNKIDVVHLAASQDFTDFSLLERRERHNKVEKVKRKYKINGQYVLSVGTNEPRKNISSVIRAFSQLRELSHPNLELVIAGKFGWGTTSQPEVSTAVNQVGFVDQKDLPALYAGASVFVYPSFYEGFGLPVLEAMTVGTPVVTSNKGSLAETVENAGVVVDPHSVQSITNGLVEAIRNSKEFQKLGKKQANKFSWKKTAEATLSIYQKLV